MEKKNVVFLTILAVATLLTAVVGATFAYFSASNSTQGSNVSETEMTTATLGGTKFTLINDSSLTQNKLNYPGGIALLKATATATFTGESTTGNSYKFSYKLKLTGNSGVTTELKWHLYEIDEATEQKINSALANKFGTESCKLVTETVSGGTHLYYTNDGQQHQPDASNTYDCTAKSLGIETQLGTYEIASGTLSTSGLENTKEEPEITDLENIERTIEGVTKSAEKKKYYYIVVEYPNSTSDQTTGDKGQDINIKLELVENSVKVELAQ